MSYDDRIYRKLLLPPVRAVTKRDAEVAHDWMLKGLSKLQRSPLLLRTVFHKATYTDESLAQTLMDGLYFPNPFGTAGGFDKNATIFPAIQRMTGAGHIELGGVTLKAQPGNERPRLVRVGKNNVINAMGFPGLGIDAVLDNILESLPVSVPLGLQLAKNKTTPDADAPAEYAQLVRKTAALHQAHCLPSFLTINVSSPNTPGLRALQDPRALAEIVDAVVTEMDHQGRSRRRLLIKLSPDLQASDVENVVELVERFDVGGLILTNTTTSRPVSSRHDERPGGFSGSDLYPLSSKLVKIAAPLLSSRRTLVATGGIDTVDRAYEMLQYADLIGGYTGLVLKGPNLFRVLAKGVARRMKVEGVGSLTELRAGNRTK